MKKSNFNFLITLGIVFTSSFFGSCLAMAAPLSLDHLRFSHFPVGHGLPELDLLGSVRIFAVGDSVYISNKNGVFVAKEGDMRFEPLRLEGSRMDPHLVMSAVTVMTAVDQQLFLGTNWGQVLTVEPSGYVAKDLGMPTLAKFSSIRGLTGLSLGSAKKLLVASSSGFSILNLIHHLADSGGSWVKESSSSGFLRVFTPSNPLPSDSANDVVTDSGGWVYVGTQKGLSFSRNRGDTFEAYLSLGSLPIHRVVINSSGLLVLTESGLYEILDRKKMPETSPASISHIRKVVLPQVDGKEPEIVNLAASEKFWAVGTDLGLFLSIDHGASFKRFSGPTDFSGHSVRDVILNNSHVYFVTLNEVVRIDWN